MEHLTYIPSGVCSRQYDIYYENNKIVDIRIVGGCPGNLLGIRSLIIGMDINEVIEKLQGIRCGAKPTSCPDQIATALKTIAKK